MAADDTFYPIDLNTYEGHIRGDLIVRCPKHGSDHDAVLYGFDEVGLIGPDCGCRRVVYGMTEPVKAAN